MKRAFIACLGVALAVYCGADRAIAQQAQQGTATRQKQLEPSDVERRQQAFDIVWTTVKQTFFDQTFGGVDWDKVRERYAPRVAKVRSDEELHSLLQQMLNELHQSHFVIIPPAAIPEILTTEGNPDSNLQDSVGESDPEVQLSRARRRLTQQLTNGIGIDLRIIGGSAVITRVESGSSAARAGLRPGFVIKKAGDKLLDDAILETEKHPLYQAFIRSEMPWILLARYINGRPQTPVALTYLDARNRPHRATFLRSRLSGEMSAPIGYLPAMYTEFESHRLERGFGYIRFNAFVPSLMAKACAALRSMHDAPGIILDLRGNQGGLLGMIGGLSGLVEEHPISIGVLEIRAGTSRVFAFPQRAPYSGPLAILIDESTQSAAEMFASGLQETKRAVLVGEPSAGNTLPSMIRKLPTGALFQYGFANFRTLSGKLLEGRGVSPDLEVRLNRRALLTSHDPQLLAATRELQRQIRRVRVPASPVGRGELSLPKVMVTVEAPSPAPQAAGGAKEQETPPPPPAVPAPISAGQSKQPSEALPAVEQILVKYVQAIGGKAAFEKLNSRVSKGIAEVSSMGLSAVAELYEKAPDKSAFIIDVPGLGVMVRGFNGSTAWWQDPLEGYINLSDYNSVYTKREADFYKQIKLKDLYSQLVVKGKEKVGEHEAYLVHGVTTGSGFERFYFDVETGLLLRKGDTYYEDYREVDGVKLPFTIREETPLGVSFTYKVSDVKHNVTIDDSRFAEYPDCFTRPPKNR